MIGVTYRTVAWLWALSAVGVVLSGCGGRTPIDAVVVTQVPVAPPAVAPVDELDIRYPPGSRLIVTALPFERGQERVLSAPFSAVGQPFVSYDGKRVLFTGKRNRDDQWQIYEVPLRGGKPRVRTAMPGGAMSPTLLSDGRLVFISPVPPRTAEESGPAPSLYVQAGDETPARISFAPSAVADPEVLQDGRILFVGPQPGPEAGDKIGSALYTVNGDGTEITAFTGQHQAQARVARPRQLPGGRVVFLSQIAQGARAEGPPEVVQMSRPFTARTPLLQDPSIRVTSVDSDGQGGLWITAPGRSADEAPDVQALYRLDRDTQRLGSPVLLDPAWHTTEAVAAAPRQLPMGRLSSMKADATTATLLCLDANDSSLTDASGAVATATHIRVLTRDASGIDSVLGEIALQQDGSFMAEVPADVPLGFEALNAAGQVVRRVAPLVWMRPGENRGCMGCHEPHNYSPRNQRPLAVNVAVPRLPRAPLTSSGTP